MAEQSTASRDVSIVETEPMTSGQFRQIYSSVDSIFRLTDAADLMSLGPSILTKEGALEDKWIESPHDFVPELKFTKVEDVQGELCGESFTSVTFFFKQGGNQSAAKNWLGDIRFNDDSGSNWLSYKFQTDGQIQLTVTSVDDGPRSMSLTAEAAKDLNQTLTDIKEILHHRKLGEVAIS